MIFLVHHGPALDPDVDPQRPLSAAGRMRVDTLAHAAARRGVRPDRIWHSGKLRARQTAETFWRACNPLASLNAVRGLQPTDPPDWMRDQLLAEDEAVLIVGHMPHLPKLLRLLTGGAETLEFPAHGMVALERDGDRWIARWRLESS